jgi:signal peptidase I
LGKGIIISGKERALKPHLSFLLSLLFTGAGEVYSGSPLKGTALALIRTAAALTAPFYCMVYLENSYLAEIFFSSVFFIIITAASPVNALFISSGKKKITVYKYSTIRFITFFIFCNIALTIISVTVFFSFFSVRCIPQSQPPTFEQGDVIAVKKIHSGNFRRGETIVLLNAGLPYARIIALPGNSVSFEKSRFAVENSELVQSVFSESELKTLSVTDYQVIAEIQDNFKYPVIQNKNHADIRLILKKDEYYAAPDDRNRIESFLTIKDDQITGRVEGILFSCTKLKFLTKTFIMAE